MMEDDLIKTTGCIFKEETLINIEHSIMPNTMVLESRSPFPGYHDRNIPESPKPNNIYLVTNTKYDGEDILRAARKVREIVPYRFDASFGKAVIFPYSYYFIRVKNLVCFECIEQIQKAFSAEGINFMKKKSIGGEAMIKLHKFFAFQKTYDNIYRDIDNEFIHYFEIPNKPEWSFFKKITFYIRGNVDKLSYDAALGTVYLREVHDIVRIYGKDMTIDQLNFIRQKYLYELAHPDHLG